MTLTILLHFPPSRFAQLPTIRRARDIVTRNDLWDGIWKLCNSIITSKEASSVFEIFFQRNVSRASKVLIVFRFETRELSTRESSRVCFAVKSALDLNCMNFHFMNFNWKEARAKHWVNIYCSWHWIDSACATQCEFK